MGLIDKLFRFDTGDRALKKTLLGYFVTKGELERVITTLKQFTYRVVSVLPEPTKDTMFILYFVPSEAQEATNTKDEYLTIDNGPDENPRYTWELVGSTNIDIDMSNYYTKSEVDTIALSKLGYQANSSPASLYGNNF